MEWDNSSAIDLVNLTLSPPPLSIQRECRSLLHKLVTHPNPPHKQESLRYTPVFTLANHSTEVICKVAGDDGCCNLTVHWERKDGEPVVEGTGMASWLTYGAKDSPFASIRVDTKNDTEMSLYQCVVKLNGSATIYSLANNLYMLPKQHNFTKDMGDFTIPHKRPLSEVFIWGFAAGAAFGVLCFSTAYMYILYLESKFSRDQQARHRGNRLTMRLANTQLYGRLEEEHVDVDPVTDSCIFSVGVTPDV